MTALIATITALCGLAATLATTWAKIRPALAPLIRRRTFPVAIVAHVDSAATVRSFLAQLRSAGYRDVDHTHSPIACLGRRAVVLWKPDPERAQELIAAVQRVAPEATVLVYTHDRLPVTLSESVLLSNSALRLRGDLGVLAESV